MTPFKAVYGRDPPSLLRYGSPPTPIDSLDTLLTERDSLLEQLKSHLAKAQNRMKVNADKHRRDEELSEGDMVYLKIKSYRMKTLARRMNEKLNPKYFGPYKIIKRIEAVAYELELPDDTSIHPVFHVSKLKKALGPNCQSISNPSFLSHDWM